MARLLVILILVLAGVAPGHADEIILPAGALERHGQIIATYRLDRPETGLGTLLVEWTDSHGRLVERHDEPVTLERSDAIAFRLDLGRAAALGNRLTARLSLDGRARAPVERDFAVPAAPRGFPLIIWQPGSAVRNQALRRLGISAGMAIANRAPGREAEIAERIGPLIAADLPWYVENIATDFYAPYHRWTPEHPVDWLFRETRRRQAEHPADPSVFFREPSLSDPAWLATVAERVRRTVAAHRPYRPLFYDLADEPGIADQIRYWDFDRSPHSLAAMRDWLRQRYGSLEALNRQWGTAFGSWDLVVPDGTTEAMRRHDENFSSWSDFKEWMDEAFARAIRAGTEAAHAADPMALAAIAGTQPPSWGFDYDRLVRAVDAMEIYDLGAAVELVRSLAPSMPVYATFYAEQPTAPQRAWRLLLRGIRGLIVWDENDALARPDGGVGPQGSAWQAHFAEWRSLGEVLARAEPEIDPVAILYSPASRRLRWMLDWRPRGAGWSSVADREEYGDIYRVAPLEDYTRALRRIGVQPRFLTAEMLEAGALQDCRVLILPDSLALSDASIAAIRRFAANGGMVIADGEPGSFDVHGRRRPRPGLEGLPVVAERRAEALLRQLRQAGVASPVLPRRRDGTVESELETYRYRDGDLRLVALMPLVTKTPGKPHPVVLPLPGAPEVYDLRAGKALGRRTELALTVDVASPTLLALSPAPLPRLALALPGAAHRGDSVAAAVAPDAPSPAALHLLQLAVIDPDGNEVAHYGGILPAPGGRATWSLPLALNDRPGRWTVRLTDLLSGQRSEAAISIAP